MSQASRIRARIVGYALSELSRDQYVPGTPAEPTGKSPCQGLMPGTATGLLTTEVLQGFL